LYRFFSRRWRAARNSFGVSGRLKSRKLRWSGDFSRWGWEVEDSGCSAVTFDAGIVRASTEGTFNCPKRSLISIKYWGVLGFGKVIQWRELSLFGSFITFSFSSFGDRRKSDKVAEWYVSIK